ncbi:hypothetical protein [Methylibium petroleiphilum]
MREINRARLIAHRINRNDRMTLAPFPSMASFPTRCTARLVARCMLALWLLGIGLGVANACIVSVPEGGHAPLRVSASESAGAAAASASDDCHPSDPTHAACRHFCETVQAPAAKVDPLTAVGVAPLAPPPGNVGRWPDRLTAQPLDEASIGQRLRPAASVRFLRLTL